MTNETNWNDTLSKEMFDLSAAPTTIQSLRISNLTKQALTNLKNLVTEINNLF